VKGVLARKTLVNTFWLTSKKMPKTSAMAMGAAAAARVAKCKRPAEDDESVVRKQKGKGAKAHARHMLGKRRKRHRRKLGRVRRKRRKRRVKVPQQHLMVQ
jgi:hypothetical protein